MRPGILVGSGAINLFEWTSAAANRGKKLKTRTKPQNNCLGIDKGKVSLSRKAAMPDPWIEVAKKYAMGTRHTVHGWIHKAMELFEQAEAVRPAGNDEPLLRWNACARFLMQHPGICPETDEERVAVMSE